MATPPAKDTSILVPKIRAFSTICSIRQLQSSTLHQSAVLDWFAALRDSLTRPARSNRRRQQRHALKVPIEVRTASGVTYPGVSRDLSTVGMGALVSAYLEIGDKIWVKYDHPARGEQSARATVRAATVKQRHGYRYGFEFHLPIEI